MYRRRSALDLKQQLQSLVTLASQPECGLALLHEDFFGPLLDIFRNDSLESPLLSTKHSPLQFVKPWQRLLGVDADDDGVDFLRSLAAKIIATYGPSPGESDQLLDADLVFLFMRAIEVAPPWDVWKEMSHSIEQELRHVARVASCDPPLCVRAEVAESTREDVSLSDVSFIFYFVFVLWQPQ